jgi:hypothetical protein
MYRSRHDLDRDLHDCPRESIGSSLQIKHFKPVVTTGSRFSVELESVASLLCKEAAGARATRSVINHCQVENPDNWHSNSTLSDAPLHPGPAIAEGPESGA